MDMVIWIYGVIYEDYNVKLNPNGSLTHLKARLVTKEYSQDYCIDYQDMFSPVAKMTLVWILILLDATYY